MRECPVDDEVGWGVCERVGAGTGAGVAAHAPGGRGVFAVVTLSRPSFLRDANKVSTFPVSSSDDGGGPGSSGRPFGGGGVWNSILEVLKDGRRGGVESSREGAASRRGEAGGEWVSEASIKSFDGCSVCASRFSAGEGDRSFSGGGISIGRAIGVNASCVLSSLSCGDLAPRFSGSEADSSSGSSSGSKRILGGIAPLASANSVVARLWPFVNFFASPFCFISIFGTRPGERTGMWLGFINPALRAVD